MIQLAFHGFCMAVADSVPGVSGGTVAFILGFYDRFIEALHNLFGNDKDARKAALTYLVKLGFGWVLGMGICALILSDLFAAHIYFMSSVFLGLTAASIPFVIISEKNVLRSRFKNVVFTALGAALVVGLSLLRSRGGAWGSIDFSALQPARLAYIFLAGMVAIAAMVLPGISGSTVLLIAGVYLPTINAVKELLHVQLTGLPGLVALGMGILCGAGLSIHFIRTALQKHRSAMIYLILGFMLGSLFAIVCGPMTLADPLPAVDLSTFRPVGFLLGIAMLLGLESVRNGKSAENAAQPGAYGRRRHALVRMLILDVVLAAVIVSADYIFSYKVPRKMPSLNLPTEEVVAFVETDWGRKFEDHFSDTVISAADSYTSPNISITLTHNSYDSGITDSDGAYGTMVSYTLADIYVRNIQCLQTAFAQDSYGIGFTEKPLSMSQRLRSILTINGDSYSKDIQQNNGTVIRNGRVYREQAPSGDTCVLFRDGSMKTYPSDAFDPQQAVRDGAWQSWGFGPSLLDAQGNVKTEFDAPDYIQECHPRTAIGYYEPGHYCFLVVDGRQTDFSRGMYLGEMSRLFAALGCKAAYNLDGGHSSFMLRGSDIASHPFKLCTDLSDGILICEPEVS